MAFLLLRYLASVALPLGLVLTFLAALRADPTPRSDVPLIAGISPGPWDLAWSPDGGALAVADRNRDLLLILKSGAPPRRLQLGAQPTGVAWPQADRVFVSEYGSGAVAEVSPVSPDVRRRFAIGGKPMGLAVAGDTLLVADYGLHRIVGLSLADGARRFALPAARHPVAIATSPDGKLALSGGLLPDGAARPDMACSLLVIDVVAGRIAASLPLPSGSSNLRGFAISRDGAFGFAVHTRGRIALPTTQPDRGWINTNALTVVDLARREIVATFLLDTPTSGAADPWGVASLPDGTVAVGVSGTGEYLRFDWSRAQRLLAGKETLPSGKPRKNYDDPGTPFYAGSPDQLWKRIAKDPAERRLLASDLAVASAPGLLPRTATGAHGLRSFALAPDGKSLAAISYFDGRVLLLDPAAGSVRATLALSATPVAETLARRGERLFHDANQAFQTWMSCATCHHEGRVDGLNWDLLNDGIGNAKNTKSMLYAPRTEPMTWLGVREDHVLSIKKGMHFFMAEPDPDDVPAIAAYFDSLRPEPSPHLVRGSDGRPALSAAALRGQKIFNALGCADCHSGELLTDLKKHDVGTGSTEDKFAKYDTPSLNELWRSAPYLHDGSAATVLDVLVARDPAGRHGGANTLPRAELDDLVAYLLSL